MFPTLIYRDPSELPRYFGGADGVRTHDLLDAIEARSQLRHGPTELIQFSTGLSLGKHLRASGAPAMQPLGVFTSLIQ